MIKSKFDVNTDITLNFPENQDLSSFDNLLARIDEKAQLAKMKAKQVGQEISQALTEGLNQLVNDSALLIGEFFANMATGEDKAARIEFGRGFLDMVGKFMTQFGQAMVAIGVAQTGIQVALASMNPIVAIGAGVALIAAGATLSKLANKGIQPQSSSASGGATSGGSTFNFNTQELESVVNISGRDLILTQRRESAFSR